MFVGAGRKYAEAETLLRKALAITLKVFGEDHLNTAKRYEKLSLMLQFQSKYAEAESVQSKALAITLKVYGEEHPVTINSYQSRAVLAEGSGKGRRPSPLSQGPCDHVKVFGEDHLNTVQGNDSSADMLVNRAVQVRQRRDALPQGLGDPNQALRRAPRLHRNWIRQLGRVLQYQQNTTRPRCSTPRPTQYGSI